MKTFATLATVSMLALAGAAVAQTTPPAQSQSPQTQPQTQSQPPTQTQPATPGQDTRTADRDDDRDEGRRSRWNRADFDALTDARMAAIQAGLKLTPEQQRLWTPVEQALRAMAAYRAEQIEERRERFQDRRERRRDDVRRRDGDEMVERLQERAQRLSERAQRVSALSDAMQPFWASLSEDQKRLAPVLLRHGRGEGRRMRMGMHRGGRGDHHGWGHYRGHHGGGYPVRWHHGGRGMMDDGPRGR